MFEDQASSGPAGDPSANGSRPITWKPGASSLVRRFNGAEATMLCAASDPASHFYDVQDAALDLLDQLRQVHHRLAQDPDPGGPDEVRLEDYLAQRDRLVHALGQALLRALAQGRRATLEPIDAPPPTEETVHQEEEEQHEPAALASLVALTQKDFGPDWQSETAPAPSAHTLVEVARQIGYPDRPDTDDAIRSLLQRLTRAVARIDTWSGHLATDQQALIGLVSSLARFVQDEARIELTPAETEELGRAFSRMSNWSRIHKPGFVPSLCRGPGGTTS